jgi:hypothetical protein
MNSQGHNGWKNYETWSIALFIDNEEEWYNHVRNDIMKRDVSDYYKSCDLREFMADNLDTYNLTPYQSQLIQATLSEVDWMVVLNHYKEDA